MNRADISGGGLHGTTRDYLRVLQAVLKCSPSHPTPPFKPLISKESFKALFTPSLPPPSPENDAVERLSHMMTGQNTRNHYLTRKTSSIPPVSLCTLEVASLGGNREAVAGMALIRPSSGSTPTTGIAVSSPVDVKDDAEDGALSGGMQHECLVAGKRQCGRTDGQCV